MVLKYSVQKHGHDAADRYELLLTTAMEAVGNQPLLPGSRAVTRRRGVRTYAIARSRLLLPKDQRVMKPVHTLVYRHADDGVAEILAIIGDSYPAARVPIPRQ
jgi:hypothetical protein